MVKRCCKCKIEKEITCFNKNKSKRDGLSTECKICSSLNSKKLSLKYKELNSEITPLIKEKACSGCKEIKSISEFDKNKSNKTGFQHNCKSCTSKRCKQHYDKNKDKIKKRVKKYADNNRGKIKEYGKEYYKNNVEAWKKYSQENAEKISENNKRRYYENLEENRKKAREYARLNKEQRRQYREDNREAAIIYNKKRYLKTKELRKDYFKDYNKNNADKLLAKVHKYRARRIGAEGSYTKEQLDDLNIKQENKCFYCNTEFTKENKYTVDHYIPLSKGGSNWIENIRLACNTCNCSKNNKMPEDFYAYLELIKNLA